MLGLLTSGSFVSLISLLFEFFYAYIYRPQFAQPGEEQRAKETLQANLETAGVL
jgi:preprotein translocase subunit YajC